MIRALFVFLLIASSVRAEYSLGKVAEFQLPVNDCWDVQHWLDNDSYGWVTARGNQISYCLDINNPEVVTFEYIPELVPEYSEYNHHMDGHKQVRICGSVEGNPLPILVGTQVSFFSGEETILNFSRLNVLSQEQILPSFNYILVYLWYSDCSNNISINDSYVWPPPPLMSNWFVVHGTYRKECDGLGTDWIIDNSIGSVYSLDESNTVYNLGFTGGSEPFAVFDSLIIAGEGHYKEYDDMYGWHACHQTSRRYRTYFHSESVDSDTVCDENIDYEGINCPPWWEGWAICGNPVWPVAQVDADGDRHVIDRAGDCYLITDNDYVLQWSNPELDGTYKYSATMDDSPDERLLVDRYDHFDVYDASDGTLLGAMSNLQGCYKFVMKQPDRASEFVAIDSRRVVRIYKPSIGLTLHVLPNSNSLRLNWHPVAGAASYTVWLTHNPPNDSPCYITSTPDTSITIPLPEESLGYFYIEVNY